VLTLSSTLGLLSSTNKLQRFKITVKIQFNVLPIILNNVAFQYYGNVSSLAFTVVGNIQK